LFIVHADYDQFLVNTLDDPRLSVDPIIETVGERALGERALEGIVRWRLAAQDYKHEGLAQVCHHTYV